MVWYYNGHQRRSGYRKSILERDSYTCQACGAPAQEVDHINPLAISHDRSPANLRAICIKCNRALRRYTLPLGRQRTIPSDQYTDYLKSELAQYVT